MLETDDFQDIMGATLGIVYAMMIVIAVIAAIPRLIAGIMGLSRASRPEKSGFFLGWGIALLVLASSGCCSRAGFSRSTVSSALPARDPAGSLPGRFLAA